MGAIVYRPIGVVHSPFKVPQDVPIQSAAAEGVTGTVEVSTEYVDGLRDVEGFSHLILIYHCHLAQEYSLLVRPFLDKRLHGVFATRAPSRPNPIGLSIVHLTKIENNLLHIQDVDIIDGTPLLDIKPFVPEFDQRKTEKIGWLTGKINKMHQKKDDGRFAKNSNM
ncbi:MAG: tRNA (N6-threonylcarbamoyladenosine(37)-N6)-methyltransferase TrmO [Candidatus Bathyarchaeota archaeon]|jgi:tRNA-Thr(GGU) m(6)t(6)A37 methyltransferase TsaA